MAERCRRLLASARSAYYAHRGEFTPPAGYFFVAPRGVNRNLRRLISKPEEFKRTLIGKWGEYCAEVISEGQRIDLDPALKSFIEAWDFSLIRSIDVDALLADPASKPVMISWFGEDPGPAPSGTVPAEVESREMPYVRQLLNAYGEREQCTYDSHADIRNHSGHAPHLNMQRERFFDADAFSRFYRDNTMSEEISALRRDMYHGVADVHGAKHSDSLARVDAVMSQAANVQPSGALAKYARVPVKQGICHHFANEGQLRWQKK